MWLMLAATYRGSCPFPLHSITFFYLGVFSVFCCGFLWAQGPEWRVWQFELLIWIYHQPSSARCSVKKKPLWLRQMCLSCSHNWMGYWISVCQISQPLVIAWECFFKITLWPFVEAEEAVNTSLYYLIKLFWLMCEQTVSLFKHPADTEHQFEDEHKANIYTFFFFVYFFLALVWSWLLLNAL